ncbi:hypothetical protein [Halomarina pelagica]|uniref:hypothetical protein n=1 Tax=Halomarina pelagica TaxID=2961599 RepID=UPI0020C4A07D|nr:hypothetical protein [Halomarina sp. BND7]
MSGQVHPAREYFPTCGRFVDRPLCRIDEPRNSARERTATTAIRQATSRPSWGWSHGGVTPGSWPDRPPVVLECRRDYVDSRVREGMRVNFEFYGPLRDAVGERHLARSVPAVAGGRA